MNSFDKRAKSWDLVERRVQNALNIAKAIEQKIALNKSMHLADLGVGTGLLSQVVSSKVGKITGIDNSTAMLEQFLAKEFECQKEALALDCNKELIEGSFDGVISSMTLHHIKDTQKLFDNLYDSIKSNGFIALADLVREDGSFHSDNTGVYHFGFDTNSLQEIAYKSGFRAIECEVISTISKPHREFEVFLLTALKPALK